MAGVLGPPARTSHVVCAHCANVIPGDVFMLADRAYCCVEHRERAFFTLQWTRGRLLPHPKAGAKAGAESRVEVAGIKRVPSLASGFLFAAVAMEAA